MVQIFSCSFIAINAQGPIKLTHETPGANSVVRNRSYESKLRVRKNKFLTSYCSYARLTQPCPIRLLLSDSVIKHVSVTFGECTTIVVTKC